VICQHAPSRSISRSRLWEEVEIANGQNASTVSHTDEKGLFVRGPYGYASDR
jgi:hypothetical protein